MHVRVIRTQAPPGHVEQGIANFKEKMVPAIQGEKGFAGVSLLVNRDTGEAASVTFWETAHDLAASEDASLEIRKRGMAAGDARVLDVVRFELVLADRAQPVKEPSFARVNSGYIEPDRLKDIIEFTRSRALPAVRAKQGYRSAFMGVDWTTGLLFVSTNWDSAADREASDPGEVRETRRSAGEMAGAPVKVELFEAPVARLLQAATAQH